MNAVFDAYAAYYDLLYRDKDYEGEASWVETLIRRHYPEARDVLELGSGTGGHAMHLARRGYRITGVDLSEAMTTRARERAQQAGLGDASPSFEVGDLRTFRAGRRFDVVLALFHVMSYQTSNEDLQAAMTTVATHMAPGGVFIFDCWYGPGVLTDPPRTRVRELSGDGFMVTRKAEADHHVDENRVDVRYDIAIERDGAVQRIHETHPMRYLFTPEVDLLLAGAGLHRAASHKWLAEEKPDAHTWNACYVAKAGFSST